MKRRSGIDRCELVEIASEIKAGQAVEALANAKRNAGGAYQDL